MERRDFYDVQHPFENRQVSAVDCLSQFAKALKQIPGRTLSGLILRATDWRLRLVLCRLLNSIMDISEMSLFRGEVGFH